MWRTLGVSYVGVLIASNVAWAVLGGSLVWWLIGAWIAAAPAALICARQRTARTTEPKKKQAFPMPVNNAALRERLKAPARG